MARFCSNCGAQITEGKKFCANCGTKVEDQQIAPPQPQMPQQQPMPQPQYQYQPQYQQPYQQPYAQPYAPIPRKKSKAPLIAGIAGGVLVIALAVVLVVTNVFGLLGKGDRPGGGKTEPTTSENKNTGKGTKGERLTKNIFSTLTSGTYHMKLKGISGEMEGFEIEMYAKGGVTAMLMNTEGMNIRAVTKSGKTYSVVDDWQMVFVNKADPDSEMPFANSIPQLIYVGEGSEVFYGKNCKYEEYKNDEGMQFFYYVDNGVFKGIRTVENGTITSVEVLVFDQNVPDSVFDIPANYEVYDSSDEPISDDPVDKIEYYELGDDKIPSVVMVVGDRFCPEKGSSLVNGATVYTAEYTTDENDQAQAASDVYAYITYLMENEGFLNLIAFDNLPYEGGIELSLAKTSVDWGKIIVLNIDYGYGGYTFEFWKGEGTLTEN